MNIEDLDFEDSRTWDMICDGSVKGCFQIEGHLGKTWAQKLKPRNLNELAALISLIRPGCLKAKIDGKSMTEKYVDRKQGNEEIEYMHDSIKGILKETYGVIVFQEQSMKIAEEMAKFDLKEADNLRKAIGKKKADLMSQVREKFLQGCSENNIDEKKSVEVFDIIEKSNRYSFNKSHAVAYAKMAYWSAYLKCYYPEKFFKHWLRNASEKIDPDLEKRQLIMAAKAEDINVYGPSIRYLDENFSWHNESIYFGVCNVKNVGKAHLEKFKNLISAWDRPLSWSELVIKVLPHINKKSMENLIKVGFFGGLKKSRSEMLHEFSCVKELTKKELECLDCCVDASNFQINFKSHIEHFISKGIKKDGGYISSESRLVKVKNILSRLNNPGRFLDDNPSMYAKIEDKLLGCAVSHSELNSCADAAHANSTCKEVSDGKFDRSTVACIIKRIKEHVTKNNDEMAFLSVEDNSGELENIVIFPDIYSQNKDIIYEESTVLLTGEIKDKKRKSFVVENIFSI
jgi:DNA polymerase III subunit alpha